MLGAVTGLGDVRAAPTLGSACKFLGAYVCLEMPSPFEPESRMTSQSEADSPNAGRALLEQWISELKEFELMVRSAQHGFKKFAGGGDRGDMEL